MYKPKDLAKKKGCISSQKNNYDHETQTSNLDLQNDDIKLMMNGLCKLPKCRINLKGHKIHIFN
jgi:hypothetical protein